ncbi:MAG: aconitase family protein, partial [Paracoccaceae bacterium]|nr:aconitase family protein [Paracoccaceae bacterium]
PLAEEISNAIHDHDLIATSVLSGNRNFEGRISPDVRANYLASPPLVVAYAIAGDMNIDLSSEPIATDKDGNAVYLKDIWPTNKEIADLVHETVTREAFQKKYADVFKGDEKWQGVETTDSQLYDWPSTSTYVQHPPYFQGMSKEPGTISDIKDARVLAILGDMVTTDHISPAGSFKDTTPAGKYLTERQVGVRDFNSYGSRRGNHEVMMRGTFANIRIRNEMLDGVEGGYTKAPDGSQAAIYDAAMAYQEAGVPLVIFGGEQYGAGSSRDWAAKGTNLLGVKAVIAESFERIHRSNLVGMGVIPFEFTGGDTRKSLGLKGDETVSISGLEGDLTPLSNVPCTITFADGSTKEIQLKCRIDTEVEVEYVENGGVLHYVLRNLANS